MKKLVLTGLVLFSCVVHSQKIVGDKEEAAKILMQTERFSSYLVNGNVEALTGVYTPDAKIFPDKRDIITGTEQVMKYWSPGENGKTTFHKVIPEEISVEGDTAYDYGRYSGITTRKDGTEVSWKGKYVIVWKKTKEGWQIYLDIWNRISE